MSQRILVTAALPYANGSIHIGHLVEYCQTDMYVRALKQLGENALYICANDAHGTPIEINAGKMGISPETLVARVHEDHKAAFNRFGVAFDHFGITHSEANRNIVEEVYQTLKDSGHLEQRSVDGNWCEHDQRFLPDRFIKGTCPKCGTEDQYGDVCESCGATYAPTDLKAPHCVLCGNSPITRASEHTFFKLSSEETTRFLSDWIRSGTLQDDVANYVGNWIETGLRDWCISRDGPYFGFQIPDQENKYFYVWLDAPLGYVAASTEWAADKGLTRDDLWKSEDTRIEHVIGKDIVYFHTLFWPAILQSVGYTLPAKIHVHGMLTVNGQKMSKSRGTFINASTFADHFEPEALRYYYACKYNSQSDDLDLSFDDFILRINGELVNKHANLFSRASQFLSKKIDGKLGDLPFSAEEAQQAPNEESTPLNLARRVVASGRKIEALYRKREFSQIIREINTIADIGNEYMQSQEPWNQLKEDPEKARETCTFCLNVCHALAMYLGPIVPTFAEAGARILGVTLERMDAGLLFQERERAIGEMERLFARIDAPTVEKRIEASTQETPKAPKATQASSTKSGADTVDQITFQDFQKLQLKVGHVLEAESVPKSKKLLRLQVDLGEESPRQIVSGISPSYQPEELVGTTVIVVTNLAPAKIMGVESNGMILSGEGSEQLSLLRLDRELPPGSEVR